MVKLLPVLIRLVAAASLYHRILPLLVAVMVLIPFPHIGKEDMLGVLGSFIISIVAVLLSERLQD